MTHDIEAELTRANADNARLRALIKGIEAKLVGRCPWCGAFRSPVYARQEPHSLRTDAVPHPDLAHRDCPAFTPKGDVR